MSDHKGYENIEFKEIRRQKKVRKKKHYLLKFLIFLAIAVGTGVFLSSGFFNIENIRVSGNSYYTEDEIITIADAKTGGNIFWGAEDSDIKDRLGKNPYFEEVTIKRSLPDTITIQVVERKQIAAIRYADNYVVIDTKGIVLRKADVDPHLTLLSGLTISRLEEGESVETEEKTTLATTLEMLDAMDEGDIFFKRIDVSNVIIRAYIYDTLVVKATPKQMMESIKTGDLQKVVNNLFKNDTTRGTISLGEHNYMSFSPGFE